MKLDIGKDNGYVIIDDNTGRILSVFVKNVIDKKFDSINLSSYIKEKENKHKSL